MSSMERAPEAVLSSAITAGSLSETGWITSGRGPERPPRCARLPPSAPTLSSSPRPPKTSGRRVFAGKGDRRDVSVGNLPLAGLSLGKELQERGGSQRVAIEDVPLDLLSGGQFQRHIAAVVEGELDRFSQLCCVRRPEDPAFK